MGIGSIFHPFKMLISIYFEFLKTSIAEYFIIPRCDENPGKKKWKINDYVKWILTIISIQMRHSYKDGASATEINWYTIFKFVTVT